MRCGSRLRRIFSILSCTFRPCSAIAGSSQPYADRDHGLSRRPGRKFLQVLERHGYRSPGASGGRRYRPSRRGRTCNGGTRRRDKLAEGVVEARIPRLVCRFKTGNHAALFGRYSGQCGPGQPLGRAAGHHGARRAIERSGGECADWRDIARPCFRSGHGEARARERVGASFCESPPIPIEARFRNEGTVHEAPQGTIEVRNI